jgi:hypothetical protein
VIFLAAISFLVAALIAIASSVWLRPQAPLGRAYWILTAVLTALPLILSLMIPLLNSRDPYGYGIAVLIFVVLFFSSIAAGWLFGTAVVLMVRYIRRKGGEVAS